MRALDGVRVLELAEGWSGAALCGRLFGELGAEVVKAEPPEGDPLRAASPQASDRTGLAFHLVAATKRSLRLSGQPASDRRAIEQALDWADLLLADAAGSKRLATLELPLAQLSDRWPQLVICAMTPFGLTGPLSNWAGGELVVEALSGAMVVTGFPDGPPQRAGVKLGAHATSVLGLLASLAALRVRDASGRGQLVDLAEYDALVNFLGSFFASYMVTGKNPRRQGNRHALAAPWNAYPTRDGWVIICAMSDGLWAPLLRLIGQDSLVGDPCFSSMVARMKHIEEVDAVVGAWTQTLRTADAVAALDRRGIPGGLIASLDDLLADEHLRARGTIAELLTGDGFTVSTVGPLFKMSESPGMVERPAPPLGEFRLEQLSPTERPRIGQLRSPRPLEGIRLLEMGAYTAGPFGPRLLATLGAEVIKIEPRTGDPTRHLSGKLGNDSYLYHMNNTDKRSVTLDVLNPRGRELLLELARKSDVFLENFAPGSVERWGIGPEALRGANPRLIYCSVSGFGQSGPLRSRRALDSVIQAMAGLLWLTGEPDRPPVKIGLSVVDLMGACFAAAAIVAALRHRDRTGQGQRLDISMHDVAAWMTSEAWPEVLTGRGSPIRTGNRHRNLAPQGLYQARDGLVVLEICSDDEWSKLCQVMKREDLKVDSRLATAEGRRRVADELDREISAWMAERSANEVVTACQEAGVPAAPLLELDRATSHPHALSRKLVVELTHPTHGPIRLLGTPFRFSRTSARVETPAPDLGQHNREVFGGLLGLSDQELEALKSAGVIWREVRSVDSGVGDQQGGAACP
jgi:crotonobetainyl-CoA:carnitine CoA-transferase CaiB-like acyl-CoA transferase